MEFFFISVRVFPALFFFSRLVIWIPLFHLNIGSSNNFIILLIIRSRMSILTFFSGWGRNSKFSLMGGVRASAQIISYEVIFSFCFLIFMAPTFNFSLSNFQKRIWGGEIFMMWIIIPLILIVILAETNRTPFDLVEGESELVRGFNTEFSSVRFVLLFLGEYSFICFFSACLSLILFKLFYFTLFFIFFFVWARASFPRKRYDALIIMMWVWYFPLVITLLCYILICGRF